MTIGDEKVVAWQLVDAQGNPVGVRCAVTGIAAYLRLHNRSNPLIPQSAYAELAAELAQVREAYQNRTRDYYAAGDAFDASQANLIAAESRLARVVEYAARLTAEERNYADPVADFIIEQKHRIANELRLAVAGELNNEVRE